MVYEWAEDGGGSTGGLDPNRAGQAIERIAIKHGGAATARQIVAAARSSRSVLHPAFTWDDKVAGERWRVQEATKLVRHLVVVEEKESGPQRRPAFFHVDYEASNGETRQVEGYQSIAQTVANPDARRSAAEELLGQLRGVQRRATALDEVAFDAVWREVDRVAEQIEGEDAEAA